MIDSNNHEPHYLLFKERCKMQLAVMLRKTDMFDSPTDKTIQEGLKYQSKYIAIVIRNAMEDFHTKHLSDAQ